jgi:hypothetical protein
MRVVLDANILGRHPDPLIGLMKELIDSASVGAYRVVVPEIAIREVEAMCRREVAQAVSKATAALSGPSRFGIRGDVGDQGKALRAKAEEFGPQLRQALEHAGVEFLPVPDIGHADLLERIFAGRKPFTGADGSDRGYKDALIWAGVLELATNDESVYFVTDNYKDFAESQEGGALHHDLVSDLRSRGLPDDSVKVVRSLEGFFEEQSKLDVELRSEIEAWLADDATFRDRLLTGLDAVIEAVTDGREIEVNQILESPEVVGTVTLHTTERPIDRLGIQTARRLQSDRALLELWTWKEYQLDLSVLPADIRSLPQLDWEVAPVRGDNDWPPAATARTSVTRMIKVELAATIDLTRRVGVAMELNRLSLLSI